MEETNKREEKQVEVNCSMELSNAEVLHCKTGKKNSNQSKQFVIKACFVIITFNETRLRIIGENNYKIKANYIVKPTG